MFPIRDNFELAPFLMRKAGLLFRPANLSRPPRRRFTERPLYSRRDLDGGSLLGLVLGMNSAMQKISVIGNAGGGKSVLSRRLSVHHDVPLTHVDSIQFLPGMKIRPHVESIEILRAVQAKPRWLIDGYGPLDILVERLKASDKIVFIDFPIWRHYWWCTKRQLSNAFSRREELPEGCDEATLAQTRKLYKTLWQVHTKMRPELKRILARPEIKERLIVVETLSEFQRLLRMGL